MRLPVKISLELSNMRSSVPRVLWVQMIEFSIQINSYLVVRALGRCTCLDIVARVRSSRISHLGFCFPLLHLGNGDQLFDLHDLTSDLRMDRVEYGLHSPPQAEGRKDGICSFRQTNGRPYEGDFEERHGLYRRVRNVGRRAFSTNSNV